MSPPSPPPTMAQLYLAAPSGTTGNIIEELYYHCTSPSHALLRQHLVGLMQTRSQAGHAVLQRDAIANHFLVIIFKSSYTVVSDVIPRLDGVGISFLPTH